MEAAHRKASIHTAREDGMKFNINDYVRVKLNASGKKILRENWERDMPGALLEKYPFELPKTKNGWTSFQLWELMREFGAHMATGFDPPFETEIELGNSTW